jgi:hypothetical protein
MSMGSNIYTERIWRILSRLAGYSGKESSLEVTSEFEVELPFNPVGAHHDGLDVSSAEVLTPPVAASKIMLQTITKNIRFTLDGSVPTSSLGFQLATGQLPVIIPIGPDTVFTVIQEAATADLQYQWGN